MSSNVALLQKKVRPKSKSGFGISVSSKAKKDSKEFRARNQDEKNWQRSSTAENCALCNSKFTFTNRKHHCRECGGVFCGTCSSHKIVVGGALKRACKNCYDEVARRDSQADFTVREDDHQAHSPKPVKKSSGKRPSFNFQDQRKGVAGEGFSEDEEHHQQQQQQEGGVGAGVDAALALSHHAQELPPWVEALMFVRQVGVGEHAFTSSATSSAAATAAARAEGDFPTGDSDDAAIINKQIYLVHPNAATGNSESGHSLSEDFLDEVKKSALLSSNTSSSVSFRGGLPKNGSQVVQDFRFLMRMRDKSPEEWQNARSTRRRVRKLAQKKASAAAAAAFAAADGQNSSGGSVREGGTAASAAAVVEFSGYDTDDMEQLAEPLSPVTRTTIFYNCYVLFRQELISTASIASSISLSEGAKIRSTETGLQNNSGYTIPINRALACGAADASGSPVAENRVRGGGGAGAQSYTIVRQAIVLITKWPFPQLAFRMLSKIGETVLIAEMNRQRAEANAVKDAMYLLKQQQKQQQQALSETSSSVDGDGGSSSSGGEGEKGIATSSAGEGSERGLGGKVEGQREGDGEGEETDSDDSESDDDSVDRNSNISSRDSGFGGEEQNRVTLAKLSFSTTASYSSSYSSSSAAAAFECAPSPYYAMQTVQDTLMVAYQQITQWPSPMSGLSSEGHAITTPGTGDTSAATDPSHTPAVSGAMTIRRSLHLHFLGEILKYLVPEDALATYGANMSFSPVFSAVDLVSLLAPRGLLQHLWLLWEIIVSEQNIVVYAASPQQCSEFVLALASLIQPLYQVGDFRPFIQADDSDIPLLARNAARLEEERIRIEAAGGIGAGGDGGVAGARQRSMIVGTSDPRVISSLEHFSVAIFLSPPVAAATDPVPAKPTSYASVDPAAATASSANSAVHVANKNSSTSHAATLAAQITAGMKSRNAAYRLQLDRRWMEMRVKQAVATANSSDRDDREGAERENDDKLSAPTKSKTDACAASGSSGSSGGGISATAQARQRDLFIEYFQAWVEDGCMLSTILCRSEHSASTQKWILDKIKKMKTPREKVVLGNRLLRENLRSLTLAFYLPEYLDPARSPTAGTGRTGTGVGSTNSSRMLAAQNPGALHASPSDSALEWDAGPSSSSTATDFAGGGKALFGARKVRFNYEQMRTMDSRIEAETMRSVALEREQLADQQRRAAEAAAVAAEEEEERSVIESRKRGNILPWLLFYGKRLHRDYIRHMTVSVMQAMVDDATQWSLQNVPTFLLYALYTLTVLVLYVSGLPPLLLVAALFVVRVPDKAPREFEGLLRNFLPKWFLYPLRYSRPAKPSTSSTRGGGVRFADDLDDRNRTNNVDEEEEEDEGSGERPDFSGVWKRVRMEQYEDLLVAQKMAYPVRKVFMNTALNHIVTMSEDLSAVRIQEQGGPLKTDETYAVGGPEKEISVMGKARFACVVYWEGARLVQMRSKLPERETEIYNTREFINGGKTIKMIGRIKFLKENKPDVFGYAYLDYVGESTDPRPPSSGIPLPPLSLDIDPKSAIAANAAGSASAGGSSGGMEGGGERVDPGYYRARVVTPVKGSDPFASSGSSMKIDDEDDYVEKAGARGGAGGRERMASTETATDMAIRSMSFSIRHSPVVADALSGAGRASLGEGEGEGSGVSDLLADAAAATSALATAAMMGSGIKGVPDSADLRLRKQEFEGIWQRGELSDTYEEILVAQGTNFLVRKLFLSASLQVLVSLQFSGDLSSVRAQEKGGPLHTDNTILIGGPDVKTNTMGKVDWLDKYYWDYVDCDAIGPSGAADPGGRSGAQMGASLMAGVKGKRLVLVTEKIKLPDKEHKFTAYREMIDNGNGMRNTVVYTNLHGKKPEIVARVLFRRTEDCPEDQRPVSLLLQ